jgi:hypothetical protein
LRVVAIYHDPKWIPPTPGPQARFLLNDRNLGSFKLLQPGSKQLRRDANGRHRIVVRVPDESSKVYAVG